MKKLKLNTAKLQLNKEKISDLHNEQMMQIKGGTTTSSQRCIIIAATNSGTCASSACQPQPAPQPVPETRKDVLCATVSLALGC